MCKQLRQTKTEEVPWNAVTHYGNNHYVHGHGVYISTFTNKNHKSFKVAHIIIIYASLFLCICTDCSLEMELISCYSSM